MVFLKNLRNDIDWFKNNKNLSYLDSGATSLKPKCVVDNMLFYCNNISTNPHNNDSEFAFQANLVMDETRTKISKFLNVNKKNIIFTSGATYSLNFVANFIGKHFLNKDDEIVLSNAEHASNLLPWYDLRKNIGVDIKFAEIDIYSNNIDNFLKLINKKTKVVSFANETNLLGNSIDAIKLTKEIKKINKQIIVSVDATQFLAHDRFDLKNSDIDFVSFSAHKMLGPSGIGALYISDKYLNDISPLIVGGGMNSQIKRNDYTYQKDFDKFEAGTPNILGIYGWNKAIDYYFDDQLNEYKNKVYELKKYVDDEISKLANFKVLNKDIKGFNTIFFHENVFSQDLASYLGFRNIIVRSGLSCAKLAHEVIKKDHVVRASYHLYTNKDDVDKLLDVLRSFKKGDELNGLF